MRIGVIRRLVYERSRKDQPTIGSVTLVFGYRTGIGQQPFRGARGQARDNFGGGRGSDRLAGLETCDTAA